MTEFLDPEFNLSKEKRRQFEERINRFPLKPARRDTSTFFLMTSYAVSYYEFAIEDYPRAMEWVKRFDETAMPHGLTLANLVKFCAVSAEAKLSLNSKYNFKTDDSENKWTYEESLGIEGIESDYKRTQVEFLTSFLQDMPMDCSISSYNQLLSFFKECGGKDYMLLGVFGKGFYEKCIDNKREDIIDSILKIWEVPRDRFKKGAEGRFEMIYDVEPPKGYFEGNMVEKKSNFDLDYFMLDLQDQKEYIDSLYKCGEKNEISKHILNILGIEYVKSHFQDLISSCLRFEGKISPDSVSTLYDYWGLGLTTLRRYPEAIEKFDKAIEHAIDAKKLSTIRLNKACALGDAGRIKEAIDIFEEEKKACNTPFSLFCWYDNLGYLYSRVDPQLALSYYSRAENYLDEDEYRFVNRKIRHFCRKARLLGGNKYLQRKALENALKYVRNYSGWSVEKGEAYTELAKYNMSNLDYLEADKNFRRALDYLEELPQEDTRVIDCNLNYAKNLCNLNRYQEGIDLLMKMCDDYGKESGLSDSEYLNAIGYLIVLGADHLEFSIPVESLYPLYIALTDKNRQIVNPFSDILTHSAYFYFQRDIKSMLNALREGLRKELTPMERLEIMSIYELTSRKFSCYDEYRPMLMEFVPAMKREVANAILLLDDEEARSLSLPIQSFINGAIETGNYDIALELSLFRKGLLFTSTRTLEKQLRSNRKCRKLLEDLNEKRLRLNGTIAYNDLHPVENLRASISSMEVELKQKIKNEKQFFSNIDRRVSDIYARLGNNEIAVDFIRYFKNDTPYYGAFILNKEGQIRFVEIGEEDALTLDSEDIWQEIVNFIPSNSELYFSTDGILNGYPLEYLKVNKGEFISDIYRMHRVFHLADIKPVGGIGEKIVAVGVSDHNSPAGEASQIIRGDWTDLRDVEYEIERISEILKDSDIRVLFNDEASEYAVKGLSGSKITTLHFTTHGFFRDRQALERAYDDENANDHFIARRMLDGGRNRVSGLILRGGNESWKVDKILDEEDDILTSDEIEMLDFPELRLTVLSGCNTGIGVNDYEGVWGLQRAFRMAGTDTLICSLQEVDDYWTSRFMEIFYESVAKGYNIYDAFQEARVWLRDELPDYPEVWKAWILIE